MSTTTTKYEGTDFDELIISVSEQLRDSCEKVTGKYITNLVLTFGIDENENKIYFCKDSVIELSKDCYEETLFGGEGGADEFNDFLIEQISAPVPKKKCITNSKKCMNPQYKTMLLDVIFSRAVDKYKKLDKKLLYDVIRSRIQKMSPELLEQRVRCCLPCELKYAAIHREYQSAKEWTRKEKIPASKEFEAFRLRDRCERGLSSVGTTPTMHKTYCYSLNLKYSPYHDTLFPLKAVDRAALTPIKKLRFAKNDESTRLSQGMTFRGTHKSIPKDKLLPPEKYEIPEPKPLPKTYSEKLAPRAYTGKPFKRDYLSSKIRGKKY